MTAITTRPLDEAHWLRTRSEELRCLAAAIDGAPLLALDRHAGPDTWRSPAADECRAELARNVAGLRLAAEDLRATAWTLDRQAAELELAARLAAAGG